MKDVTLQKMPDEAVLRRLTAAAKELVSRRDLQAGYPFDQETNLSGFYEWLLETGLCNTTLISVGSPIFTIWRYVPGFLDIFEMHILTPLFPLRKNERSMQNDISCESAVAIAAPAVPNPRVKMKTGSRTIFRSPPVVMPTMPSMAFPSARR